MMTLLGGERVLHDDAVALVLWRQDDESRAWRGSGYIEEDDGMPHLLVAPVRCCQPHPNGGQRAAEDRRQWLAEKIRGPGDGDQRGGKKAENIFDV